LIRRFLVIVAFDIVCARGAFKSVLHEIKNVRQEAGAGRRRWFESDGLELVVWFDASGKIDGFQICYELGQGEHALTWRINRGFMHSAVDTGDDTPLKNRTPVLTPDNDVPWLEIARLFDARAETLEPALRQLVHDKLSERAGLGADR
jgi:hypothetical protein